MSPVDSVADMPRAPRELLADDERPATGDRDSIDQRDGAGPRDTARPADSLRQRMDHLPAGHPSSPYEADGRLRQPTPRLHDLDPADEYGDPARAESGPTDTGDSAELIESPREVAPPADQIRPLTDAEWADHVEDVRAHLGDAHAEGLETDEQYTIDGEGEIWSDERAALHDTIIEELLAESHGVPCEGKAIIAGGLGGAGKSTVLDQYAGIDRSQYLTINPDNIKGELARRNLIPWVEGLTPVEASELVHEEASYIAKQLGLRAEARGINIIWDITMSTSKSTDRRIDELVASGYQRIDGLFVDIPIEVSVARADSRHRVDHEKYRTGEGLGGRYVPPEVIKAQADADWGSQNRKTFEGVKHRFDNWSRYDNSIDDRAPLLVEASTTQDLEHEEASR